MAQVKVTIGRDGQVTVDAEGFKGKSCEEATAFIEKLFPNGKKEHKPEYYQHDTVCPGLPNGLCG
jgi:hypothetical protein